MDVRPIQAATAKGTMEIRHLVTFRVEDGLAERLEIPMATLTREDALEAIKAHVAWKQSITGTYKIGEPQAGR